MQNKEEYSFMENPNEEEVDFMPLFSANESPNHDELEQEEFPEVLPILALKNTVLFPGVVIPITIGRAKSVAAIEANDLGDFLS